MNSKKEQKVMVTLYDETEPRDLAIEDKTSPGFYGKVDDLEISDTLTRFTLEHVTSPGKEIPALKDLRIGVFVNLRTLRATNADLSYFLQYPKETPDDLESLESIELKNTTVPVKYLLGILTAKKWIKIELDEKTIEQLKFDSLKELDTFQRLYNGSLKNTLSILLNKQTQELQSTPQKIHVKDRLKRNEAYFRQFSGEGEFDTYMGPAPKRTQPSKLETSSDITDDETEYPSKTFKHQLPPHRADKPQNITQHLEAAGELYSAKTKQPYYVKPTKNGESAQLLGHNRQPLLTASENHTHIHSALLEAKINIYVKAEMLLASMGLYLNNPDADFSQEINFHPEREGDELQQAVREVFAELKQVYDSDLDNDAFTAQIK